MNYTESQIKNILNLSNTVYLWRSGGIGDVFMLLPLLNYLIKNYKKTKFKLLTNVDLDFFKYSPLKKFILSDKMINSQSNLFGPKDSFVPLNSIQFGVKDNHQINNYFEFFNLHPSNKEKRIDLLFNFPHKNNFKKKVITIHASKGDKNRTWSKKNYIELITELLFKNFSINLIGKSSCFDGYNKELHKFEGLNVNNFENKLSPSETMLLINSSDLLVATDTGPIQLAVASNTPIIGLYSVVKGVNRLSFNNSIFSKSLSGGCDFYGCFHSKLSREFVEINGGYALKDFCFYEENKYACLNKLSPNVLIKEINNFFNNK